MGIFEEVNILFNEESCKNDGIIAVPRECKNNLALF